MLKIKVINLSSISFRHLSIVRHKMNHSLLLVKLLLSYSLCHLRTLGLCRQSFLTFCDNTTDLKQVQLKALTELVIGSEHQNLSKTALNSTLIPFKRLSKIKGLTILNKINELEPYSFDFFPQGFALDYLKFHGNNIARLRPNTFKNLDTTRFTFTENHLEYIQPGAFVNCKFETIDFSNNQLESVDNEVFKNSTETTIELVLKFNKINRIEPGSLPPNLEILSLDHNSLKNFEVGVFENLNKLTELTLSYNKFTHVPDVFQLTTITILDLSYNKISQLSLNVFNDFKDLYRLDLSHNHITSPDLLLGFVPDKPWMLNVYLNFNLLTFLNINSTNITGTKYVISLYGNPWNCRCWNILEKFLEMKEIEIDPCDLTRFGNGAVPFCISYFDSVCIEREFSTIEHFTKTDLEKYVRAVKTIESKINCELLEE